MTKDEMKNKISMALKDPTLQQGFEIICKGITDLEKENAELKGLVNQYKASKCGSISLVNRNMIMFDQLAKAKEIIEKVAKMYRYSPRVEEIIAEAEQFIKDSEVEK